MSNHVSSVHENPKTMNCGLCSKSYSSKIQLTHHLSNVHEPKYACDLCDKRFGNRGILRDHVKRVHEGKTISISRFPCKICSKTFTRERYIPHHMSSVHEGKKYACTSCGKKLSDEGSLKRHINLIHEGKKSFDCQYKNCDYVTNDKQNLLAHQSIHDKNMGFIHERNISMYIKEL